MRFIDENGALLGLIEASRAAIPLRLASSRPRATPTSGRRSTPPRPPIPEAAASTIASLFSEDVDPVMADRLASAPSPKPPPAASEARTSSWRTIVGSLGSSPTPKRPSSPAFSRSPRRGGPRLLLADGSGSEGSVPFRKLSPECRNSGSRCCIPKAEAARRCRIRRR